MNVSINLDELAGLRAEQFGRVVLDSPGLGVLVVVYDSEDPAAESDLIVNVPDANDAEVQRQVRAQLDPSRRSRGWQPASR